MARVDHAMPARIAFIPALSRPKLCGRSGEFRCPSKLLSLALGPRPSPYLATSSGGCRTSLPKISTPRAPFFCPSPPPPDTALLAAWADPTPAAVRGEAARQHAPHGLSPHLLNLAFDRGFSPNICRSSDFLPYADERWRCNSLARRTPPPDQGIVSADHNSTAALPPGACDRLVLLRFHAGQRPDRRRG